MDDTLASIFALKTLLLHKSGYSRGRYTRLSEMSEDGVAVAYLRLLDNSVKMLEEAIAAGNAPSTQQSSSLTRPRKSWEYLTKKTQRAKYNEWCIHAWYMGGATITDPATRVGLLRMALAMKLLSAKFWPPKPLLHERILAMIKYVHERDQNASFRESVKRAFVVATTTATITSLHTPLIKTRTRALFRRKARA